MILFKKIILSMTFQTLHYGLERVHLTHSDWDQMAAIKQMAYSKAYSCATFVVAWIQVSMKKIPGGPLDNWTAWV